MAIAITPITAANSNFGPLGSAAWAAGMQMTGLGTNQLLYSTGATTLAQSSGLTFDGTNLVSLFKATGTGSAAAPAYWIPDAAGAAGMWQRSSGVLDFAIRGVNYVEFASDGNGNAYVNIGAVGSFVWSSGAVGTTGGDLWLSRQAAGVMQIGTTGLNSLGSIRAKHQSSDGTAGVASFGPSAVASITVKDGIITAIS